MYRALVQFGHGTTFVLKVRSSLFPFRTNVMQALWLCHFRKQRRAQNIKHFFLRSKPLMLYIQLALCQVLQTELVKYAHRHVSNCLGFSQPGGSLMHHIKD